MANFYPGHSTVIILSTNRAYSRVVAELLVLAIPGLHVHTDSSYANIPLSSPNHCILLDVKTMPDPTRYGIKPKDYTAGWIAVNTATDDAQSIEWVEQGYSGVVHSGLGLELLPRAVSVVLAGDVWYSRGLLTEIVKRYQDQGFCPEVAANKFADEYSLTRKEHEVCKLMLHGLSNMQIADKSNVSINTVKTHISKVLNKLSIHSRNELMSLAMSSD
ncbi:helix-turn-helix transcriptional regulator [Vibrio astriarenae]|uniref:helix-turn-helix transcriptional regulator n=1 Tax=Vibrio astriarenae TaxID=1481923 RepID=UPI003735CF54